MKAEITLFAILAAASASAEWSPSDWPVLRSYDQGHLYRIALPLGGIGTGSVSLGGRGELTSWEMMNVPAKNYLTIQVGNDAPFFALHAEAEGVEPVTTALVGPFYDHEFEQCEGHPAAHHGLPHFSHAAFDAAYPFGQVRLWDEGLPVKVTVKGFNPLVPGDPEASGIPLAALSYEVENLSGRPMKASVCGSMRNFIGRDGTALGGTWYGGKIVPLGARGNRNEFRRGNGFSGIYLSSTGVDTNSTAWGTLALVTEADRVTARTRSTTTGWANAIVNFWDDFSDDGELTEQPETKEDDPMASLAVTKTIPAGGRETFTFLLVWSFPNRKAWSKGLERNWYVRDYPDAWTAAEKIVPRLPELEGRTLGFVNAFLSATIPAEAKEAALFNLAVLRSPTVFRLADGHMMAWEGAMDSIGSCHGSCTHVWNYEQATAFLFGSLARSMRDIEFNYGLRERGDMAFRVDLPLEKGKSTFHTAADGQMGCIVKFYREWQLSGDKAFLADNWPQVKKALAWAWEKDANWDVDQDGVMEGDQHNTMDVWYKGPNPEVGFWYLAALKAGEKMARAMKDDAFADKCARLFANGSAWTDGHLFNGEYYEHIIYDLGTRKPIDLSDPNAAVPEYQIGNSCLADQFVGQMAADICGLGPLADEGNIRTALCSIMKYNYKTDFLRHFNNMRTYAMADEGGLLIAAWPKGRLKVPFPYYNEVWTGIEYGAAVAMVYAGMEDDAMKVVRTVRARQNGSRRNPFSEPECGNHYARSMASWGLIPALAGFRYSGVDGTMAFADRPGTYFWSNGYAFGTCTVKGRRMLGLLPPNEVVLRVIEGCLDLKGFSIGEKTIASGLSLGAGETAVLSRR